MVLLACIDDRIPDLVQITALRSIRETGAAIPRTLTDSAYTDSYIATSGLDNNLWWYIVDYGCLSNLGGSMITSSFEGNKSRGNGTTSPPTTSTARPSTLASEAIRNAIGSDKVSSTNTLEASMFDTLENDLETLLADWHEDGASFPDFATTIDDGMNAIHEV